MMFHLVTTNQGDWQVHKVNCKDVLKMRANKQANNISIVNMVESPEELIERELRNELAGMGYSKDDFRIMPCCKGDNYTPKTPQPKHKDGCIQLG